MDSLKRMTSTLLDIVQTRLELLADEFKEERLRIGQMLLLGSIALFCFGLSILLFTVLIVVMCWDGHRELVLAGLTLVFLITGFFLTYKLRCLSQARSSLFFDSLSELAHDIEHLDNRP